MPKQPEGESKGRGEKSRQGGTSKAAQEPDLAEESEYERKARYVSLLCAATIDTDKGIKRLCDAFRKDDPSFPAARTIRDWIVNDDVFAAQYARAKELQAEHIFEQILDIADDDSEDAIFIGEDGEDGAGAKRVANTEFIQRSKLRVDARKWVLAKLVPRKYGDKVTQEVTGPDGGPQEHVVATATAIDFDAIRKQRERVGG